MRSVGPLVWAQTGRPPVPSGMIELVSVPPAIEIARRATLKPIGDVAAEMGIASSLLEPYGASIAKISLDAVDALADRPTARYVVVTAVTPTPLGEGKTTTTVGLGQALACIGKRATIAIRQASMGPTFGIKGGAAGGGYSQVVPFENLNLHLTGDLHAVTAANNLLAAMVDNHLYGGNALGLDPHGITCSTSTTARSAASSACWAPSRTACLAKRASTSRLRRRSWRCWPWHGRCATCVSGWAGLSSATPNPVSQ
jgi:hypothetical protein